MTVIFLEERL